MFSTFIKYPCVCEINVICGQFAFHVGLPAKSSASGAMLVVVPNLMGICLYSPALDEYGNTCRGVEFCKEMISRFSLHNYDSLAHLDTHKFDPRKRVGEQERDQVISLLFAARTGDMNTLRRLFMQKVDMSSSDYDKRTALHVAAAEGQLDVVKFLVNIARVKIDAKDRWGRTPMDDAVHFQHNQIIVVLEKAAEITVATNDIAMESNLSHIQSDGKLPADVSVPGSSSSSEDEFEIEIPNGNQENDDNIQIHHRPEDEMALEKRPDGTVVVPEGSVPHFEDLSPLPGTSGTPSHSSSSTSGTHHSKKSEKRDVKFTLGDKM
ncbi:unnamed protein product [Bursaphelenchus okinawaensis]|uniref:glutaminase n=1 Tax=Bursaphelenchus okinawaensis TaxID=465554 RepID=A0A811KB79_9BILA|nr:unnamed protein product [Bursaphelenchus okinawaensis]CAG9098713.1 unnamed protein product [Bursaphelenchus okinawaensis]